LKNSEIHVMAVGGRLINRVDQDLSDESVEVRNMVLKVLKNDFIPTVLALKKID